MVHRAHSSAVAAVWRSPMVDARRRRLVTSVGHVTRRRRRSSWGSCGTQFWYAHRPVVGDSAGVDAGRATSLQSETRVKASSRRLALIDLYGDRVGNVTAFLLLLRLFTQIVWFVTNKR